MSDKFVLFDLRVTVASVGKRCTCGVKVGDYFEMSSGKISLPPGQSFCVYALQSTLPLLPAKQRPLQSADWMETDIRVTCPDPACRMVMRIDRTTRRTLRHDDTSAVKPKKAKSKQNSNRGA